MALFLPTSQFDRVWLDRTRGERTNMADDDQYHESLNRRIRWRPAPSPMSRSAAVNLVNAMGRQHRRLLLLPRKSTCLWARPRSSAPPLPLFPPGVGMPPRLKAHSLAALSLLYSHPNATTARLLG